MSGIQSVVFNKTNFQNRQVKRDQVKNPPPPQTIGVERTRRKISFRKILDYDSSTVKISISFLSKVFPQSSFFGVEFLTIISARYHCKFSSFQKLVGDMLQY